jgi:hypothetical protein
MELILETSGATRIMDDTVKWMHTDTRNDTQRAVLAKQYLRYMDHLERVADSSPAENKLEVGELFDMF